MICERIFLKDKFEFLGKDGKNPYADIYLPYNMTEMNRQNDKRPCLIICPGGEYEFCSQRESEVVVLKFLPMGFNAFVLNYSVAPHRFPSQLREVAALVELIYENAEEWNCDTEKIAIMGFSAGGHLAAHYSTSYDCCEIREVLPSSKQVSASVLCYPVITADKKYIHKGSFINLLGRLPDADDIEKFSCDKNVTPNTPPAFIWHTADDNCVLVKNSFLYAEALNQNEVPFELHIYPFGSHGLSVSDSQCFDFKTEVTEYNKAWVEDASKWLKFTLKLK